jgi:hypothetical protein
MTAASAKWYGWHVMLIRGRWGFELKAAMSVVGRMRDVTPGKWASKKDGREVGFCDRLAKCAEGRKRVHVKEPS